MSDAPITPDPDQLPPDADGDELMLEYAADLAEGEDRRRAEAWLSSGDPEAAASLARAQATLAGLLAKSVEPQNVDESQWARLSQRLDEPEAATAPADPVVLAMPRRGSPWPSILTAAAAAAILAGGITYAAMTGRVDRERDRAARLGEQLSAQQAALESRQSSLADELASLRSQVDADRQRLAASIAESDEQRRRADSLSEQLGEVRRQLEFASDARGFIAEIAGTDAGPGIRGRAFLSGDLRTAQVSLSGLEPLGPGQTYQFWVIPEGQNPTAVTTFSAGDDGTAELSVDVPQTTAKVSAVAVSREPAGGSPEPTPTGPVLATGGVTGG